MMPKALELSGKRFPNITVIDRVKVDYPEGASYWNYVCDCGYKSSILGTYLTAPKPVIKSCGCIRAGKVRAWAKDRYG
jgi:hypothetical protein